MVVGILAFQGNVAEHRAVLRTLGVHVTEVRTINDLLPLTHLIIPGGESTVMDLFLKKSGIGRAIVERCRAGSLSILGTCAGAIVLAKLGILDADIERNAYGSQVDSFDSLLEVQGGREHLRASFIRAPRITRVGRGVAVLAKHEGDPVVVCQGSVLATTCHPEMRGETLLHAMFLGLR